MRISDLYFEWLIEKVCKNRFQRNKFSALLRQLQDTPFVYRIEMDANRESDGRELRRSYCIASHSDVEELYSEMDMDTCTVLEMMVALAIDIEDIMYDLNEDTTYKWFWYMIKSLGLNVMSNDRYDYGIVYDILDCWMSGIYDGETGQGGLFILRDNKGCDLREFEIWKQAMWYLAEVDDGS